MPHPRHEAAREALAMDAQRKAADQAAFSNPGDPAGEGQVFAAPHMTADEGTPVEEMPRPAEPPEAEGLAEPVLTSPEGPPIAQAHDVGITGKTTAELEEAKNRLAVFMAGEAGGPQAAAYEKLMERIDRELSVRLPRGGE